MHAQKPLERLLCNRNSSSGRLPIEQGDAEGLAKSMLHAETEEARAKDAEEADTKMLMETQKLGGYPFEHAFVDAKGWKLPLPSAPGVATTPSRRRLDRSARNFSSAVPPATC
ncbi:hypothetical protein HBH98_232430 [Parastagonospora nodorum]|nr:hypothetical protein HBH46_210380 [Parastagonospora nodorum]KAH4216879.1 hypothetical protein HBI06_224100 [Parastagonospora nodorum]KAH4224313.1 hypothetical protein HBI05_239820 [Parastagonospora nodorum]KAH4335568.1 hypothetical protein HBH98_232430 [Parastagonospora nodorum]KAH4355087.1 hypothetical protein HBH97_241170 [Parastagonospora nodorum]